MASRSTLKDAQELKIQFEQDYPNIRIVVISKSGERRVGRRVAESKGFEIVEDSGGIMVTVKETRFEILEARQCGCGTEYTTRAIGERGFKECRDCREIRMERHGQELNASVKRESARVKEVSWRDAWEKE